MKITRVVGEISEVLEGTPKELNEYVKLEEKTQVVELTFPRVEETNEGRKYFFTPLNY